MEQKRRIDCFQDGVVRYFEEELGDMSYLKGVLKIGFPMAMFLSGIGYDKYGDSDVEKVTKDDVFKYLKRIEIGSKGKQHEEDIKSLSFCANCPLTTLYITNRETPLSYEVVSQKLQTLKVESSKFNFDAISLRWPNLTKLIIRKCGVPSIPPFIFTKENFPHLKILDLQDNKIEVLENIEERPLDQLNVSKNKVKKIRVVVPPSISLLNLSHNNLTTLRDVCLFYNLREIDLSNNQIVIDETVNGVFNKMFTLTRVNFKNNNSPNYKDFLLRNLPSIEFGQDLYIDGEKVNLEEIENTLSKIATSTRVQFDNTISEDFFVEKMKEAERTDTKALKIEKESDVLEITSEAKREMRKRGNSKISVGKGNMSCLINFNEEDADYVIKEIYKIVERNENKKRKETKEVRREDATPSFKEQDLVLSDVSDKASSSARPDSLNENLIKKVKVTLSTSRINVNDGHEITGEDTSSDSVDVNGNSDDLIE
ncbi:hypothetical protein EIN_497520 [Entamoeba invadens IP1]|uniref:Leucine-rich repeat containing protein n=1 Tax=Entamoeba invadens IP1 TaxID=370355 RepID=A0A0A1UDF9_ENTIV|nr:hypothetical protein EIN_497520 [Entamoeba invadens IP1]ELP94592.1 hypothetical protein EIN_497520 [Entamoeba invadens IP1]|eukprot:XP_004261363.1 hypothetical protein EIN_497520 [Entamoeba invadens IP1]